MPLKARRMKGLRMDEVSGVDAPAHLSGGWMVLKSADGADPLEGLSEDEIADVIKALEAEQGEPVKELIESLTKALGTMPESAKAQVNALIGLLGGNAGDTDDPVAKAVAEALTKAQADREAAEARATTAEDELAKAKGGKQESDEEALAKAMAQLPEPVRKRMLADQERLAKAEKDAEDAVKKAEVEREARVLAEYVSKAKGPDYDGLPVSKETLATILRETDEKLSKEAGAELGRILKAAAHQARDGGGDYKVWGGDGQDVTAMGGDATLLQKADELQKADPKLSRAEAVTKAADAIGHDVKEG